MQSAVSSLELAERGSGIFWVGLIVAMAVVPLFWAARGAWRIVGNRRGRHRDVRWLFAEVERALADPVLIHQARRRLRRRPTRDA